MYVLVYASNYYPGSYHDITIFKESIDNHLGSLVNEDGSIFKLDSMTVKVIKESDKCVALTNKGYTEARWYV